MINVSKELRKLNNSKLNKTKIIAKNVRNELEKYYEWEENKSCFTGMCHSVANDLIKELKINGIYSYKVNGLYYGASNSYQPDLSEWTPDEIEHFYDSTDGGKHTGSFGYNHWWVVADNKFIVDITQDQFHPDEPEQYRVVITTIGDDNYGT